MGIICDGMGGHSCGEVASKTVADAITSYWTKLTNSPRRNGNHNGNG